MMHPKLPFGLALAVLFAAGCTQGSAQSNTDREPADPPVPVAESPQAEAPRGRKMTAPDKFQAKFETSAGDFVIEVTRSWSPNGADRFYQLVKEGFYDECRFFRVVPGFMVQFGINGDPKVQRNWRNANIPDDEVVESNQRGYVTFAKTAAPNSRSTQIFINYGDNSFLDRQGFSPFGRVTEGMDAVEKINDEYRERPDQGRIQGEGNEYLNKVFPRLDYVKRATIVEPEE